MTQAPDLLFGVQNARDDKLLRRDPDRRFDLGPETRTDFWWATDVRRRGFVRLFRRIGEHLEIGHHGRVGPRSYRDAVELAGKITAAVDLALDEVADHCVLDAPGGRPFLFAFDVERHQLETEEYPEGREPFYEDPRDAYLGRLLLGQVKVRARQRFGLGLLATFYRAVRPVPKVEARGEDPDQWGVADPAYETQWGGAAVAELLHACDWYWGHGYIGELEESWKGATPYSYGWACAVWHRRQMELAGVAHLPAVLCEWAYRSIDENVEPWMRGALDAGWPGGLAVCGDWKAGEDDSDQDPRDQAAEIADLWRRFVYQRRPWAAA